MNLLMAALFLAQEKTAEETFGEIEKKILEAKTISAKFCYSWGCAGKPVEQESGMLLVKSGNRALFFESGSLAENPLWVCDGKRILSIHEESDDEGIVAPDRRGPKSAAAPAQLETHLRLRMTRAAIVIDKLPCIPAELERAQAPKELFRVSGFTYGEKEGRARSLGYRLFVGKQAPELSVTLWYDAESLMPLRKKIASKGENELPLALTETYTEFALNEDLPDQKFKLPGRN